MTEPLETRIVEETCPSCNGHQGWWQSDGHCGREWRYCQRCINGVVRNVEERRTIWVRKCGC